MHPVLRQRLTEPRGEAGGLVRRYLACPCVQPNVAEGIDISRAGLELSLKAKHEQPAWLVLGSPVEALGLVTSAPPGLGADTRSRRSSRNTRS